MVGKLAAVVTAFAMILGSPIASHWGIWVSPIASHLGIWGSPIASHSERSGDITV